jgi:hypothetical protein
VNGRITLHGAIKAPTLVRLAGDAGIGAITFALAAGGQRLAPRAAS